MVLCYDKLPYPTINRRAKWTSSGACFLLKTDRYYAKRKHAQNIIPRFPVTILPLAFKPLLLL